MDIKTHMTYKYGADRLCRGCGQEVETYGHIVNCCKESIEVVDMKTVFVMDRSTTLAVQQCLGRVRDFLNTFT